MTAASGQVARSPLLYFGLVFVISLPFWLVGASGLQLLPGLPVSALQAVCPAVVAFVLIARSGGVAGLHQFIRRAFAFHSADVVWLAVALLVMPGITTLAYECMRATGARIPAPMFSLPTATLLLGAFLVTAVGEELGWSAYATGPLQARSNALRAALLIGAVWAVWHLVPLVQAQRPFAWIAGWSLGTVAMRVLIVWLYNNTQASIIAPVLFHAMSNVSWQLFPNSGSYYDPRFTAPLLAIAAMTVVVVWGPRKLQRSA